MNEPPDGEPPPEQQKDPDGDAYDKKNKEKKPLKYEENDKGPYQVMIESKDVKTIEGKELHIGNFSHLSVAKKIYDLKIDSFSKIEKKGRNRVCVTFARYQDANDFLNNEALLKQGYSMFIPAHLVSCKGLVRFVDRTFSEEEILKFSTAHNVKIISVKRLNRRVAPTEDKEAEYVPTGTVLLTFAGTSIPKFIEMFRLMMPVEPYVMPIVQCYRCFYFGHTKKNCRSKEKCKNCGSSEAHDGTKCSKKCVHCDSEAHTSLSKACPEMDRQKTIREMMSFYNLSYYDANLRVPKIRNKTLPRLKLQDFPVLSHTDDDSLIPVEQRRNFVNSPTNTFSQVVKKRRVQSPVESMRVPPLSRAPGYDVAAHRECLFYPDSRMPRPSKEKPCEAGPSFQQTQILESTEVPSGIRTLLESFNNLTVTHKKVFLENIKYVSFNIIDDADTDMQFGSEHSEY